MFQQFVNRTEEIKSLNGFYRQGSPQFIVIYGRRRVGKTELIKQFITGKDHIYFLAGESKDESNIKELQSLMNSTLKDTLFEKAEFKDWFSLFKEFKGKIKNKKIVLVIDEFSYLIKQNSSIPSIFQKIWDEILSQTNIYLILCGSSISMMERDVLSYQSPLFGRRTGQWKIEPLKFKYLNSFFPKYKLEQLIQVFAILDAIPLYLQKFDSDQPIGNNILNKIFSSGEFLYQEAEFLLKTELREPSNYFTILKAISFGNYKAKDIINSTGLDKTLISKYLDNLIKLHIIKKEFPVTSKKEKSRDTLYRFKDNYFQFWFRFVYSNKSMIEEGKNKLLLKQISDEFKKQVSFVFEEISRQFLLQSQNLPFIFNRIGKWWDKKREIDIVAINEQKKEIMFCECKWQENINPLEIFEGLKEKARFIDWNNQRRKEYYIIIAKSFKNRKIKEPDLILFDLKDMEKEFSNY